ncbi:MAG: hypothetical protein Q9226_001756 [Calogaya cf. arnoldii]
MLLRFRIRNLKSPLGQISRPASVIEGVLINIGTDVYDELIAQCPPAALIYLDEEDQEWIRVGSALELVERLQDPAALRNLTYHISHHTFDIDQRADIVAMWTPHVARTSHGTADQRTHYFQATNPPVIKPSVPEPCFTQAATNSETSTFSQQSNLTGEGKRQAQAAGEKLRAWYFLHHHQPSASTTEAHPAIYQNRWASYGKDPTTFLSSISNPDILACNDSSLDDAQHVSSAPVDAQLGQSFKPYNAQAVNNKARDGTNLVKRTKTRSHILDPGGVSNRRISYTAGQPLKLEDRVVNLQSTEAPKITPVHDTQSSLIEVFNNELKRLATKDSIKMDHQQENGKPMPSVLDLMQNLSSKLQTIDQRSDGGVSQVQTVQHGICAALHGFCTAIQDVADSIQDESNAESLTILDNDKADGSLLDNGYEGLSDLASATALLQTHILPTLRSVVEKSTRRESQEPAGERFEASGRFRNVGQNPNVPFLKPNHLVNPMADTATMSSASGPLASSSDPNPSTINCHNMVYPVVDSRPAATQASTVDEAFSSTFFQNVRRSWADGRATAERRFPTIKRFEQESSMESPAFRYNPNKLPQMPEASREKFPTIATREHRPYTFRPTTTGSSHPPPNHEEPLPTPEVASRHHIGVPSSTSRSPTSGPLRCQPSGFDTSRNGNRTNQQVFADSYEYPHFRSPNASDTTSEVRALQAADVTDHGDPATVAKIQACVEELTQLGFSSTVKGGVKRLLVYAQAASGELVEAIDMINEESQVYQDAFNRGGPSHRRQGQHFLA